MQFSVIEPDSELHLLNCKYVSQLKFALQYVSIEGERIASYVCLTEVKMVVLEWSIIIWQWIPQNSRCVLSVNQMDSLLSEGKLISRQKRQM